MAASGAGRVASQPAGDRVASAALARCRGFGVGDGGVGISARGRARRDRRAAFRDAHRVRAGGARRGRRSDGAAPARRRARAVARPGTGRRHVRVVRAGRDRAARGAAPRSRGGTHRRAPVGGGAPAGRSPSSSSWPPSIPRASGWSACSCWPCIAADARPTRWRCTRRAGAGWTRSSDSSPRRSCGVSKRRSCARILRSSRRSVSRSRKDGPRQRLHRFRLSCSPGPLMPLVGRTAEVAQLAALLDRARTNGRQIALVGGEPGSGKTRLAREFAEHVTSSGMSVLYGACDPAVRTPYQPLVEALEPALASTRRRRARARRRPLPGVVDPPAARPARPSRRFDGRDRRRDQGPRCRAPRAARSPDGAGGEARSRHAGSARARRRAVGRRLVADPAASPRADTGRDADRACWRSSARAMASCRTRSLRRWPSCTGWTA